MTMSIFSPHGTHNCDVTLASTGFVLMIYRIYISSTPSCDFRPLVVISDDLRVISDVFVNLSQEKNIVEEIESIMGARAGTEFTLVSLYSTEITRHHSWFLEYKITRVNSPPHGRPWCILYITVCSYRARQAGRISQSHPPPAFLATCFGTRMYNSKKENIYNAKPSTVPQARYRAQAACPIRMYMIKFRFQTLVIDNWAGDNSRHHLYSRNPL